MISYPLPPDLTNRDQLHQLVAALHYYLRENGLDPALNLTVEDFDEVFDDGTAMTCFAIFVSEAAAEILQQNLKAASS
jgi:hypothetical protein